MTEKPTVSNLVQLEPHAHMEVDDTIEYLYRNKSEFTEVMVIGYSGEDFFSIHSAIPRKDALWLVKQAELDILGIGN